MRLPALAVRISAARWGCIGIGNRTKRSGGDHTIAAAIEFK
jgi:hypothetical protein